MTVNRGLGPCRRGTADRTGLATLGRLDAAAGESAGAALRPMRSSATRRCRSGTCRPPSRTSARRDERIESANRTGTPARRPCSRCRRPPATPGQRSRSGQTRIGNAVTANKNPMPWLMAFAASSRPVSARSLRAALAANSRGLDGCDLTPPARGSTWQLNTVQEEPTGATGPAHPGTREVKCPAPAIASLSHQALPARLPHAPDGRALLETRDPSPRTRCPLQPTWGWIRAGRSAATSTRGTGRVRSLSSDRSDRGPVASPA